MMLLQRLGVIGISAILIYALYRKKVGNKKLLCTIFWKQKEEEKVGLQVNGASQFCSHIALPRPHICFSLNTHGCNKVGWTSSFVCLVRKYSIATHTAHHSQWKQTQELACCDTYVSMDRCSLQMMLCARRTFPCFVKLDSKPFLRLAPAQLLRKKVV
jgi:hypothetical protein